MKLAMPVNDKSIEASISDTFGRTSYFLIYDTETQESVFVDNSAANSQGGAGIKAAQIVVDYEAEALLTPQCGENAAKVLRPGNIKIYKTKCISIKDTIAAFNKGELSLIEQIHSGFHTGNGEK
jgi:predicted Fe-Mo cluster-binding NifX family protein